MKFYVKGARLMWAESLFTAKANQPTPDNPNPKPKYQGTFVVESGTLAFAGDAHPESPVGATKGYKFGPFKPELSKAILAAANEKFGPQAPTILATLKAQNRLVLHDGAEKGEKAGYVGNFYFNASNATRPAMRMLNGAQVEGKDGVFYPGCYVDGVFDVWAFPQRESVNISVLAVTFVRDGERIAGGVSASEDDYAPVAEGAQQAAADTGKGAASLF